MVYNALAAKWHSGYECKPRFYIFLGKNSAMQRQRHHTPGTLGTTLNDDLVLIKQLKDD